MGIKTIEWKDSAIKLIDQTKLPGKFEYLYVDDLKSLWRAIKTMQVRGAPALGAAAALGLYLGIRNSKAKDFAGFLRELSKVTKYIASSRPTARNLFWALERINRCVLNNKDKTLVSIKKIVLDEAKKIIEEDREVCRKIASFGAKFIRKNETVLTLCNAGILATIDYGTALGIIYKACKERKNVKVFVCETRPVLQGARLSVWELKQKGVDVTLICDSMAATVLKKRMIDKVIVGADRIAANGDTANKIGTYSLAVLCRYHKIPFYIAAPTSTFDLMVANGLNIPIEERDSKEITELFFKKRICAKDVKVFNPAFDVTPNNLITAIITDKGVIKKPFVKNIKRALNK